MKKILLIDLEGQKHKTIAMPELKKYLGGYSMGLKILRDNFNTQPLIFCIGPLNNAFPYASKTAVTFHNEGTLHDLYLGGSLSSRIKSAGLDAIVLQNEAQENTYLSIYNDEVRFIKTPSPEINELGLPGKKTSLRIEGDKALSDSYFTTYGGELEKIMKVKNLAGFTITGSKTFEIKDLREFKRVFNNILKLNSEMAVERATNPSCVGCPMGCEKSRIGESGGNILVHSLVACTYSKKIYADANLVFSCLNTLGYDYTHEDIEEVPKLTERLINELG